MCPGVYEVSGRGCEGPSQRRDVPRLLQTAPGDKEPCKSRGTGGFEIANLQ